MKRHGHISALFDYHLVVSSSIIFGPGRYPPLPVEDTFELRLARVLFPYTRTELPALSNVLRHAYPWSKLTLSQAGTAWGHFPFSLVSPTLIHTDHLSTSGARLPERKHMGDNRCLGFLIYRRRYDNWAGTSIYLITSIENSLIPIAQSVLPYICRMIRSRNPLQRRELLF